MGLKTLEDRYEAARYYMEPGVTQRDVAERFGTCQPEISKLMNPVQYRRKKRAAERKRVAANREHHNTRCRNYRRRSVKTLAGRVDHAIRDSRRPGRERGYKPIRCPAEKLVAAFKEQNGECAICGQSDGETRSLRLRPDHCHKTGRFRGWLCHRCNWAVAHYERFAHATLTYLGS